MLSIIKERFHQKYRTIAYPREPAPELPDRFAGRPVFENKCEPDCSVCRSVCPTGAITFSTEDSCIRIDVGRCIFCRACENACPRNNISFSRDHRLAAAARENLVIGKDSIAPPPAVNAVASRLFGRSLKLRQVSAGGCNACEADSNVLGTPGWDMGRFGIQFVASPRHADGLLITGPVTNNMRLALEKTYAAVPEPKIVIAVGACAISGGVYSGLPEQNNGADSVVPVDLYVPGCPHHPLALLDGLLRFLSRKGPLP